MDQQTLWYIAQAIGFIAFAFGAVGFLQKNDRRMKTILTGQGLMMTIHFGLLGANGGMAAAGVTTIRNFLSRYPETKRLAPLFLITYVAFGIYSYTVWYDILPIIASCISTIAFFYLQGIIMRASLVGGTTLWLIHNIVAGSIGLTLMEIVNLAAHFTTIYRLRRDKAQTAEHQQTPE